MPEIRLLKMAKYSLCSMAYTIFRAGSHALYHCRCVTYSTSSKQALLAVQSKDCLTCTWNELIFASVCTKHLGMKGTCYIQLSSCAVNRYIQAAQRTRKVDLWGLGTIFIYDYLCTCVLCVCVMCLAVCLSVCLSVCPCLVVFMYI